MLSLDEMINQLQKAMLYLMQKKYINREIFMLEFCEISNNHF